ncbi:photosynthetic NDH subunit of subcomplex B 3, chloroplastic [Senna tora]|uniref:Photosynthetic NDH subunit of subcomplex B 3, chloroplastic n=1 Tax=Senna tora TaxID=362788 RepID=A0A834T8F4_9FABA|nr:photosynthetic NDH subunit of subcomplex B 3, chloroplastic [Senna tora]
MAFVNRFAVILRRSSNISAGVRNSEGSITHSPQWWPRSVSAARYSSQAPGEKPEVELEFLGAEPGSDGSYPVEKIKFSGEKPLRTIMLDNKIDLYPSFKKVMNCRGRGLCGTCIVEIVDGNDILGEKTSTELKKLKMACSLSLSLSLMCTYYMKPESYRLACQTIVGNNSGKVVVQKMPQYKK